MSGAPSAPHPSGRGRGLGLAGRARDPATREMEEGNRVRAGVCLWVQGAGGHVLRALRLGIQVGEESPRTAQGRRLLRLPPRRCPGMGRKPLRLEA